MSRVMVVDDDPQSVYLLEVILKAKGHTVDTAANGKEALDKATAFPPDLIISDILMPVMDGFTLCHEWMKRESIRQVPFVFYTATYTDTRDKELASHLGAREFFVKPADPERLMERLTAVLIESQDGQARAIQTASKDDPNYHKLHNERLIQKLEQTKSDLEKAVRDLTARRDLEDRLRHTQKMEAMEQLAGGVARDFGGLLSAIVNAVELLKDEVIDRPRAREEMATLLNVTDRATDLVRRLLTFARGTIPMRETVDLNQVIADSEKELRRLLGAQMELTVRPEKGVGTFTANVDQIHTVLRNLVLNARDATPPGGRVVVETSSVSLTKEDASRLSGVVDPTPGRYVALTVSDNGSGMRPEVLSRIFEPFYTTKPISEGKGLGLSVVYGIVRQHGGYLAVESDPNHGSTFSVYFR